MLLIVASFPTYFRCPTWGAANSTSSELYSWVFLAPFVFFSPMESWNLKRKSIHAMLCGSRNTRSLIFIEALELPRFFLCGTVLHAMSPRPWQSQGPVWSRVWKHHTVSPTGAPAGLEHLWDSKSSAGRGSKPEFCKGQQCHLHWEET